MIAIRSCESWAEMEACVELQIETWGYNKTDVIPRKTFRLAQKIGGQVIGAFAPETDQLVGFAMSLPGIKAYADGPHPYLHSHMLAVRPGYRNQGLGARLKREQRIEALGRGIRHMEWTFDPLEIKNAFLNIHRLGAVVREYRADFYGESSSPLQGGLPTDRLLAEWELDSPRVEAILAGHSVPAAAIEERIAVPADIEKWKACDADRERARAVQAENSKRFQQAFSRGLAVIGFVRDADGNGVYQLGRLA